MLINSGTKIAALLKHNPDALEAIVSLSPDFKKLRNPVLRKLMAGRTSIAMASKIGACLPEDFFRVLQPLGFELGKESTPADNQGILPTPSALPTFIAKAEETDFQALDVRQMLATGTDPLRLIQQTVKDLPAGKILKIVNTFEPTPLIALLGKQGFTSHVQKISEDHIVTYFFKTGDQNNTELLTQQPAENQDDWNAQLEKYNGKIKEIDVRHLEMPQPMMTILESLETLPEDHALYVHHKRIPVFLLGELSDRKFDYRIQKKGEGTVFLLIFRK
ncbi:MAG: DUF2249 domain-containing protein [Bacteroidetes bacterium]|nr:DUF2249 domain-containing protein [Bacteroidota bacterium]